MASLTAVCRASARRVRCRAAARGLATSTRCLAAHNFIMPALSPTMTEGNIASWKVRDGEAFRAGDVLLEIETDKATMDVEAQDDGVMMRILSADGSKAVQVGARIAVVADAGEDPAALEMPADEPPQKQRQPAAAADGSSTEAPPRPDRESRPAEPSSSSSSSSSSAAAEQRHRPLMPAVEHLVRQNGLAEHDVRRIKPTGPNGRLLKGDVLAFLGTIKPDAPAAVSDRFVRLSRLDLSGIKVAAAASPPRRAAEPTPPPPPTPSAPPSLELNVSVSLAKAAEVQRRLHRALGVLLPLSAFVSRAADVANDELPPAAARRTPSPAELFDQVLGLDGAKAAAGRGSRGAYLPRISAAARPPPTPAAPRPAARPDLIDELARPGRSRPAAPRPAVAPAAAAAAGPGLSSGANVFSLVVPREEAQRARVFLERCKSVLEEEPGRLVI